MKLYKYASPGIVDKIFRRNGGVYLKASLPKDFNDPFELFLTLKTAGVAPEVLAFYQEVVGNVPQWPTVCFSKRPDVIPMWAHYGHECSGFAVQVDEEVLTEAFPDIRADDVSYSSEPTTIDIGLVQHAAMTCKPRHSYFVQSAALSAAYFTKNAVWNYEAERRVVLNSTNTTSIDGDRLLRLPKKSVTGIIIGPRANAGLRQRLEGISDRLGVGYLQLHIPRNSISPFFTSRTGETFTFDGASLTPAGHTCIECGEPVEDDSTETCAWCDISEAHRLDAARSNPLRMLANFGMLEDYVRGIRRIADEK
jgi:hypothetical protein